MFVPRIAQAALVLLAALPAYNAQMLEKPQSKRATVCNGYSEVSLFVLFVQLRRLADRLVG